MSKKIVKYKLLKDLPMYPAGTIVIHEYEELPSQFSGTYVTGEEWYTNDGLKVMATPFLKTLVSWCATSQRNDTKGWVEELTND